MNNRKECNYRVDQTGMGHCYMFKNEPRQCGQFSVVPYAKSYRPFDSGSIYESGSGDSCGDSSGE